MISPPDYKLSGKVFINCTHYAFYTTPGLKNTECVLLNLRGRIHFESDRTVLMCLIMAAAGGGGQTRISPLFPVDKVLLEEGLFNWSLS